MQNKTKIIVIGGIVVAILVAVFLTLSLRKKPQTASLSQKVTLEEKLDSPEIGLSMGYPKGFTVTNNNSENFSLQDESNPLVVVNIQKLKKSDANDGFKDIYTLIAGLKQSFQKVDPNCKFLNETKFIKNQNQNTQKFPGIGFEVEYNLENRQTKYFLATIQKGDNFYVFSLSAPLSDYPNKIGVITSMLGTLNLLN